MFDPNFDAFCGAQSAPMFQESTGKKVAGHLLWGDGVRFAGRPENGRVPVHARGRTHLRWVEEKALDGGRSLLEIYFIDVGQGDGVLIKTPDFRHIMIDGGHPRASQNTGKSAADFVDWKFVRDYGTKQIALDAMISSHNDFDHYGGLSDILDCGQDPELNAEGISVENFYHAGISWWVNPATNQRTLGPREKVGGSSYFVQLLENRRAATKAVKPDASPRLQGNWRAFIEKVVQARRADGRLTPIERLSQKSGHLPGFGPADDGPTITVLGPLEEDVGGKPGLPSLGGDSQTTNGNSVLLRLDHGRARILLTGDLNKASQLLLLERYAGRRLEFQCDVAKACHHGSDDVAFSFLQAMHAAATVISSGDGEGHDHPRPRIVAASGATGYLTVKDDQIITPLVYSTELARSVSIGKPQRLTLGSAITGGAPRPLGEAALRDLDLDFTETKPGALRPETKRKRMSDTKVVAGLVYGLVNVRTDGETILTATMNEGNGSWSIKTFRSRF